MKRGNVLRHSALLGLLCLFFIAVASAQQIEFITSTGTWTPPSDAYGFEVSAWGAGGGSLIYYGAFNSYCTGGGGSGALVNASVSSWSAGYYFDVIIGQGGSAGTNVAAAGDGTATVVLVKDASGNVVQTITAYPGGGASYIGGLCLGGAGGGASSGATNSTPGTGTPPGGGFVVEGPFGYWVPKEGATVGNIKAGGAGGYSGASADVAAAGRSWTPLYVGGNSIADNYGNTFCAGGAAGAGGDGPSGACAAEGGLAVNPPANSGSGGGTQNLVSGVITPGSAPGAAGGVRVSYFTGTPLPPSASPSNSRAPSASRTRAPSVTPSRSRSKKTTRG